LTPSAWPVAWFFCKCKSSGAIAAGQRNRRVKERERLYLRRQGAYRVRGGQTAGDAAGRMLVRR
jgi:hypothetical protein